MATDFELAVFEQQFKDVHELPEAALWILGRDDTVPLGIFVTLHPHAQPNEVFKARLRWMDLFKAPSLKFIDMVTGSDMNPCAWPRCFGFRPINLDACLPWTVEGQNLHPEWANSAQAFPKVDAPVQFALLNVQGSLDATFEGRHS